MVSVRFVPVSPFETPPGPLASSAFLAGSERGGRQQDAYILHKSEVVLRPSLDKVRAGRTDRRTWSPGSVVIAWIKATSAPSSSSPENTTTIIHQKPEILGSSIEPSWGQEVSETAEAILPRPSLPQLHWRIDFEESSNLYRHQRLQAWARMNMRHEKHNCRSKLLKWYHPAKVAGWSTLCQQNENCFEYPVQCCSFMPIWTRIQKKTWCCYSDGFLLKTLRLLATSRF